MPLHDHLEPSAQLLSRYEEDGFLSPIDVIDETTAAEHKKILEWAEARVGPLHYKTKIHTILRSPFELATHPVVLDTVEALIGPDILLYNVEYIIKEPHTRAHVSWHQDLTYWGLSDDDQVSMWLALSPATEESGCMRMIPGSHKLGRCEQDLTNDSDNILFHGQMIREVDTSNAVYCSLKPGQASFHHGWTIHSSMPNRSDDRRIGVNAQYIAPHVQQTKVDGYSALLVRGKNRFGHYVAERIATRDLDPDAIAHRDHLQALHTSAAGAA